MKFNIPFNLWAQISFSVSSFASTGVCEIHFLISVIIFISLQSKLLQAKKEIEKFAINDKQVGGSR